MKNSAYKFWSAVEKALAVVQWMLLALIFPVFIISGFMQETGWNPGWAPSFLGRDGGGILGCVIILDGTFIVWLVKRYIALVKDRLYIALVKDRL